MNLNVPERDMIDPPAHKEARDQAYLAEVIEMYRSADRLKRENITRRHVRAACFWQSEQHRHAQEFFNWTGRPVPEEVTR